MSDYWALRRLEALSNSANAANAERRALYLQVAEYYRSLEVSCSAWAIRSAAIVQS